jgi:hypothetical protein
MMFPESVVEEAWRRARGKCECRRGKLHHHPHIRCDEHLIWANRGRSLRGGWEARPISNLDDATLSNCQILCWDCYKLTLDF